LPRLLFLFANLPFPKNSSSGFQVVGAMRVGALLSNLATAAERVDLERAAQQRELSKVGGPFQQPVHPGYLNVLYSSASDTKDVMMRFHVAVIARDIVKQRYLARLSHLAELLENPMNRCQRNMGMLAAYCGTNPVGARMILRSEQRTYHCEPLRGDGQSAFTTSRHEFGESLY
jgi:hypothetical protein